MLCSYVNVTMSLDSVCQSTISRMKDMYFKNVDVKRVGSNFSKCTECVTISLISLQGLQGAFRIGWRLAMKEKSI
jgi:hypothetical protein